MRNWGQKGLFLTSRSGLVTTSRNMASYEMKGAIDAQMLVLQRGRISKVLAKFRSVITAAKAAKYLENIPYSSNAHPATDDIPLCFEVELYVRPVRARERSYLSGSRTPKRRNALDREKAAS